MTSTAALVADYTARFAARHLDEHSIGSGLGVWLLLALLAPAAEGADRASLETELGTSAEDACRRAAELLARPHPAVLAAVAVWDRPEAVTAAFDTWSAALPDQVERGDMPDQAAADAWADRNTKSMIPNFPVEIDASTIVVLASALATDVSWTRPFGRVPAERLGGDFGASVMTALEADRAHEQLLVDTDAAGLVAAHVADAASGLRVISVIGSPATAPDAMHRATHQVAALLSGEHDGARRVDLFDLPLGEGHAWTLTEQQVARRGGPDRTQRVTSLLAAWTARSDHDLIDAPGMAEAGGAVKGFIDLPRHKTEIGARQSAFAQFHRAGFRAAALTAVVGRAVSFVEERIVVHREAEVRFNRPYAVLAIALGPSTGVTSWAGVPVFSAWVGRVEDTPPED